MTRPEWDQYFMKIARVVAERGTCDRKQVGAVITVERHIVATGYNGAASGEEHCDDVGHDIQKTEDRENCVRTIHAEQNAFLQAAKFGTAIKGGTLYTNTFPCWICARMILGSGILRVVYESSYNNDSRVLKAFESRGIELVGL